MVVMMVMVVMVVMMVKKLTCSSYISSITPVLCWSGTKSGVHCNNVWCASIYFSAFYGIVYTVLYSVMYTLHLHTMQRRKSRHCGTALIAITMWFERCTVGHRHRHCGGLARQSWHHLDPFSCLDLTWTSTNHISFKFKLPPFSLRQCRRSDTLLEHFAKEFPVLIVWLTRAGWELQRVQK